jgi:hypothetical protein
LEQTKSLPLLVGHFQLFSLEFSFLCLLKHQEAAKLKNVNITHLHTDIQSENGKALTLRNGREFSLYCIETGHLNIKDFTVGI